MSADEMTHLPADLVACSHGRLPCATCTRQAVLDARLAASREHENWKEQVTDLAHEYANENNLCGTFDDFMDRIGLRRRELDYTVYVEVTMRVEVNVRASSERRAEEEVSEGQVADAIRQKVDYRDFDWSTDGAEVDG